MISAPILSVSCLECGVFKVGRIDRGGQSLGRKVEKAANLLGGLLLLLVFFLASAYSSGSASGASSTGAGSSTLGSSLTATKRPITSLVLIGLFVAVNLKLAEDDVNL